MSNLAVTDDYASPTIRDLGELSQLTRDFDASFHGSIAKLVSIAAVSIPTPGGGGGGGGQQPVPQPTQPTGNGGVLPNSTGGGGNNPTTTTPTTTTPTTTPTSTTPDGNGVLGNSNTGSDPSNGTGPSGGSGGSGGDAATSASTGGKLPFTGYQAMAVASVGAALAGAGAAVRSKLKPGSKSAAS